MEKKKSWKRKVIRISLIVFGLIILFLVGANYLLTKLMQGPEKIELTEYYPFISAEAKEQCLALYKEYEKSHWPVESESLYVDTSYGKTFVRITGPNDAPPLVLLHGLGINSLDWGDIINKFSKEFRTYAVDTIGDMGLSICTTPITKPDDYVQWMDELFTGLGLDNNINLMGASYGGWLTGLYAVRFQNRLNKVVLLEPGATIAPINPQFLIRLLLSSLPLEYFTNSLLLWLDPTTKEIADSNKIWDFTNAFHKLYKVTFTLKPTVLTDEELKSIKCPVLFLVGDHERVFSVEKAMERLEKVVPHYKKKIIPGTGHVTMPISPLAIETIMAFLRE